MTIKFKPKGKHDFINVWNSLVKIDERIDMDHDLDRMFLRRNEQEMRDNGEIVVQLSIDRTIVDDIDHYVLTIEQDDVILDPPIDPQAIEHKIEAIEHKEDKK